MTDVPTICIIHEAIGDQGAIARVARAGVQIALDAGWRVSVVAKYLDPSLIGRVEWLKLYVPPRGFAVKWLTARVFISAALGGRRFDVIHAHQPQAASMADIFQCHFLTRASFERGCLTTGGGWRRRLARTQEMAVMRAEDRCYRHRNPNGRMLYNSELTEDDFHRLYGPSQVEEALVLPCPSVRPLDEAERSRCRNELTGAKSDQTVIGFLGGTQPRKGYGRLLDAIEREGDLFLLMGGPGAEEPVRPLLQGRMRNIGYVKETRFFYAACDFLIVPSHYEPLGLVAFEAAAHDVPVIATDEVGALTYLQRHKAGRRWDGREPLGTIVREMVENRAKHVSGCRLLAAEMAESEYARRLLAHYEAALTEKREMMAAKPSLRVSPFTTTI